MKAPMIERVLYPARYTATGNFRCHAALTEWLPCHLQCGEKTARGTDLCASHNRIEAIIQCAPEPVEVCA